MTPLLHGQTKRKLYITTQRYSRFAVSSSFFIVFMGFMWLFNQISQGASRAWRQWYKCSNIGDVNLGHTRLYQMKAYPRYWLFAGESTGHSPHKVQQGGGGLMFSLICAWTNTWANDRDAGDLRRYRAHYDVTVMIRINVDQCQTI